MCFKLEKVEYKKSYLAKEEHMDIQDIMDGLYYPFYMEDCRHAFIKEILDFDFEREALNGVFMVLSKYTLHFVRSLRKGNEFTVTCSVFKDKSSATTLHFKQTITLNGKLVTKGIFSGTCIPAKGGRPFLPAALFGKLEDASFLEV